MVEYTYENFRNGEHLTQGHLEWMEEYSRVQNELIEKNLNEIRSDEELMTEINKAIEEYLGDGAIDLTNEKTVAGYIEYVRSEMIGGQLEVMLDLDNENNQEQEKTYTNIFNHIGICEGCRETYFKRIN